MTKVLALINLNLFDGKSQVELYKALMPLYKTAYDENERIVFYCYEPLKHSFDDLPADLLIQLQKMLVYIDIPNFFCLLVTNNENVKKELKYVCDHYAVNEQPIEVICLK